MIAEGMIEIISYESRYQPEFKRLNMEWLESFGLLETHDLEILDDPEGEVINKGGQIFLAKEDDIIIGTAGIYRENEFEYELVKMAVDPRYRGRGISKILLERCLEAAKELKAKKLFLFSNSQLTAALNLYKQYGFYALDATNSPFETADVKMELVF